MNSILTIFLCLFSIPLLIGQDRLTGELFATRSEVIAQNGMVASSQPLCTQVELPPNGQGIAALQILNVIENFDVRSMGFGSTEYMHHFTEAKKLVFEDRAKYYADMEFAEVPVKELISKSYGKEHAARIDPNRAQRRIAEPKLKDGDTIYLTVADKNGNMVSLIQSNYRGMGSGMTPTDLGFILQDRGELFSLDKNHRNAYEPGKRPFHTIIPAFITKDGKPYISFGLMGGGMQPQGHAQIVINLVDFDMNLQGCV